MTQHDNQNDAMNGAGNGPRLEDVTREQGGQFSMESDSVGGPLDEELEAVETAELREMGAKTVNALQVSMDRSGAEYINAQKTFLTNSGAKTIDGDSSKLTQSGVMQLTAKNAELHQSSAVFVAADDVQVESSSIGIGFFDKGTVGEGTNTGVMVAGDLEAQGDINTFLLVSGDVKAGGSVTSTLDASTAAAFGAAFGAVFALVWKMIRRG